MDNNFGGEDPNRQPSTSISPVPEQHSHSNGFQAHRSHSGRLNHSFSHSEEVEDKVVAKTLNELDADILQAMENLSITDEDLRSTTSSEPTEKVAEENKSECGQTPSPYYDRSTIFNRLLFR